jgi:hypothetical protein
MEPRVAGTLPMLLVCDRRAEECCDAILGVLLDRALRVADGISGSNTAAMLKMATDLARSRHTLGGASYTEV